MKVGIIGTGNMGTILTEAFIEGNVFEQNNLMITNRNINKALALQTKYNNLNIVTKNDDMLQAKLIFLCVKPMEIYPLIKSLQHKLTRDHCLVSITSPITVTELEKVVNCSIARVIPSITNRALCGATLITFGENCTNYWQQQLIKTFSQISRPIEIEENITRISSDIVSCGPAFYSYITERFIKAAIQKTEISEEKATMMVTEMLIGLGKLLEEGHYTLSLLREKVCVKGGITGEGIEVLEQQLGNVFENVFEATNYKFEEDKKQLKQQFNSY